MTDDAIRGALLSQGWKEDDIFAAMGGGSAAVVVASPRGLSFMNLFEGRLMRWQYFVTSILLGVTAVVFGIAIGAGSYFIHDAFMYFLGAMYVVAIPLSISLSVRRTHDLNWSGWYVLCLFIPIVGLVFALLLWFKKGTEGPNTYGPPQGDRGFKNTLLNL